MHPLFYLKIEILDPRPIPFFFLFFVVSEREKEFTQKYESVIKNGGFFTGRGFKQDGEPDSDSDNEELYPFNYDNLQDVNMETGELKPEGFFQMGHFVVFLSFPFTYNLPENFQHTPALHVFLIGGHSCHSRRSKWGQKKNWNSV